MPCALDPISAAHREDKMASFSEQGRNPSGFGLSIQGLTLQLLTEGHGQVCAAPQQSRC